MRAMIVLAMAAVLAAPAALADSSEVKVLRGPGSGPLPKLERPEPQRQVVAGERFWIVDQAAGTLTGCRMLETARVGGRRVACARRALPAN